MLRLVLCGASALAGGSSPKLFAGAAEAARQRPGEEGLAGGQTSSRQGATPVSTLTCPACALHLFPRCRRTTAPMLLCLHEGKMRGWRGTFGFGHDGVARLGLSNRPRFWRGGSRPGRAGGRFVVSPGPDSQRREGLGASLQAGLRKGRN